MRTHSDRNGDEDIEYSVHNHILLYSISARRATIFFFGFVDFLFYMSIASITISPSLRDSSIQLNASSVCPAIYSSYIQCLLECLLCCLSMPNQTAERSHQLIVYFVDSFGHVCKQRKQPNNDDERMMVDSVKKREIKKREKERERKKQSGYGKRMITLNHALGYIVNLDVSDMQYVVDVCTFNSHIVGSAEYASRNVSTTHER